MIDWLATQRAIASAGFSPGPIDGKPGTLTYAGLLCVAAQRNLGSDGVKFGQLWSTMVPKYDIDDEAWRLIQFLANTEHETGGFTRFEENLTYTNPARLVKIWPSRFNLASAALYVRQPKKLAEKVYGGRFGNPPGRAWDYRGGGWIQTTFYDNYAAAQKVTGLPLLDHPELLHDPLTSLEPACAYWKGRGCNQLADSDRSGRAARVRVNGGTIGLEEVMATVTRLSRIVKG
jgi:putative chitinase